MMFTHFEGMIVSEQTLPFIAMLMGYSFHFKNQKNIPVFILTPLTIDRMTFSGGKILLPAYDENEFDHLVKHFPGEICI